MTNRQLEKRIEEVVCMVGAEDAIKDLTELCKEYAKEKEKRIKVGHCTCEICLSRIIKAELVWQKLYGNK